MDHEELTSSFKSPNIDDFPSRRTRVGSGTSVSSTEKETVVSPLHSFNFYASSYRSSNSSRAGSEGRDENDPPVSCSSNGDHSMVNPFEKDILAGLQSSFWSPSILEIHETPPQRSWAIEHLSQLFPKDIENSPSTHQNSFPTDAQTEAKAQADIDVYFNRGPIVPTPSPMKERVIKVPDVSRLKTTSTDIHCGHHSPITRSFGGVANGINVGGHMIKKLKKSVPVTERWTQTNLSFPVNLPTYMEQMLMAYSQNVNICGTSEETENYFSQKSEASLDFIDSGGDTKDSGKNSSSLNNSIRRRLELSFGDDLDGDDSSQGCSQGTPASPIADPFRRNHIVSTPPNSFTSGFLMNTTTSELEVQLMRCEFTPEARGRSSMGTTPGITPIHDEPDEMRLDYHPQHACSTPRRNNNITLKRWTSREDQFVIPSIRINNIISTSPTSSSSKPTMDIKTIPVDDTYRNKTLRRSRVHTPERPHNKKRCSASSFEDSQLLMDDESSPPAKLYRRNSQNDDNAMSGS